MKHPLISVIIPVYNEENHIKSCAKSLLAQTYSNYRLFFIDDGSTDNSSQYLSEALNTYFDPTKSGCKTWNIMSLSHQGPGAARNLGAQKSRGDILVFVDADMRLDPKFLDKLTLPIRKSKTIGTFTKDERVANGKNPWAKSWGQIRGFKAGRMHQANYPDKQPVFRAIKRKAFLQAGGFDTNRGYDDDWTLAEKLGSLAQASPGAIIYHHNPASPGEIFTQARWMAKRKYKLGVIGKLGSLARASLPITKLKAVYRLIRHQSLHVFAATFIFDLGITLGILESFVTSKTSR